MGPDKYIRGTFEVVDGELSFTCSTKGVSFEEVEKAITKLRDECQRQLNEKSKCPYFAPVIGFKQQNNDKSKRDI